MLLYVDELKRAKTQAWDDRKERKKAEKLDRYNYLLLCCLFVLSNGWNHEKYEF